VYKYITHTANSIITYAQIFSIFSIVITIGLLHYCVGYIIQPPRIHMYTLAQSVIKKKNYDCYNCTVAII